MRRPPSPPKPRRKPRTPPAARTASALEARLGAALAALVSPKAKLALALSGGGDSVALMLLLAAWTKARDLEPPTALIVDHGLRPEAAGQAAKAARWAKKAGLRPHILRWQGAKPNANIEDEARLARYRLMGDWCTKHGVTALLTAHTRDDQAETFLLRLGRGSGVDGLSAMRARASFPLPGCGRLELLRPLLDVSREELRAYLAAKKATWIEDPMNDDSRFFRSRVRALLPALEKAGIPRERIAAAAAHLARAREALEQQTEALLADHARFDVADFALLDAGALRTAPREIGLRAFARALMRVSGESYRPRLDGLERVFDSLRSSPAGRTLHGCKIAPAPRRLQEFGPGTLLIERETPRKAVSKRSAPHKKHNLGHDLGS